MIRDSGFLRQHRAFRLPQRHLRPETRPVLRRAATVGAFCGERWCLHHGEDGKFSAKEMAHFLTEDWFAWSSLPRQFLGIPYNAKAGCHVPLNLNQLDNGYLILKDDEVFCGSDWIPLLKSETMVGDNERRPNMNSPLNSSWPRLAVFCLGALLAFSVACNRGPSQPGAATGQLAAKRYSLKGRVISVDKNAATANIDNEPIAGFMDAMIMPYTIKPPSTLDQLQPGDSITADVVVEPDRYWLENVKVTGHSKA